jgi:hypothetical protein
MLFMSELVQFRDTELSIPHAGEAVEAIGFYPREFYVCDNFAAFQIEYGGVVWAYCRTFLPGGSFL